MTATPMGTSQQPNYDDDKKSVDIMGMIAGTAISNSLEPVQICEKCLSPIQMDIEILGTVRRMPVMCKCRMRATKENEDRERREAFQRRLDKFKAYSLMDERFSESTFENWTLRDDNRNLLNFGRRYCENWEKVTANNRGLLIYGAAGNGKTFLSFAIANELYKRGETVLAISVSRILKIIMDTYGNHSDTKNMVNLGEIGVLNTLYESSLLILDDLGVENKTLWAYEKLYSIIDTRYRAKRPTIITTNLTLDELRDNLSIVDVKTGRYDESNRIYNRIVEMCVFIEVTGESWRIQKGLENKDALFRELGLS